MEVMREATDLEIYGPAGKRAEGVSEQIHLSELVRQREEATGRQAAVFMADGVRGRGRLLGKPVEFMESVTILMWLTRSRSDPDAGDPQLIVRHGSTLRILLHLGILEPSGHIRVSDPSATGSVALGAGCVPHATEPRQYLVEQHALARSLVAAILPRADAPTNYGEFRPEPPDGEMPMDIYDPAIPSYADPHHGAPLEVVWRTLFDLSGIPQFCVLNADIQPDPVRIPFRQMLSKREFVIAVRKCLEEGATPLLAVRTGLGGHAVTLKGIRDRRFVYMDPWGGRSLLCAENNSLGVAAVREAGSSRMRWSISEDELARVGCACNVASEVWARVCGIDTAVHIDEVIAGDFGQFFHLREAGRHLLSEAVEAVHFKTGGFQDHVDIWCTVLPGGKLVWASLRLARQWLETPPNLAYGADIALSFLETFVPAADHSDAEPLFEALSAFMHYDRERANRVLSEGPVHLRILIAQAVATLAGASDAAGVPMLFSHLLVRNLVLKANARWLVLDVITGAARPAAGGFDPEPLPIP